jgi:archaeosine synthase
MMARIKNKSERKMLLSIEEIEQLEGKEMELADEVEKGYSLYIIKDFLPVSRKPEELALGILRLRREIGTQPQIYCAGAGELNAIAPLAYAGVDLFDTIECVRKSREHILMERSFKGTMSELSFDELLKRNVERVKEELELVRSAIESGSIRELAEARSIYDSNLNVFMRAIDREYRTMEAFSPTASKSTLKALSCYSLSRAEFESYRRRVLERYRKPESAETLLILPCSARKPYFRSKSHRLFAEHIKNRKALHELIVTSPLGIVPRELEIFFPCANYDIHVSHHWYEDEKEMIKTMLAKFLEMNRYKRAIVHFEDPFFLDVLEAQGLEVIETCFDNNTKSESSLQALEEATESLSGKTRDIMEDMSSAALFQFGANIFEGCSALGKYPYIKIMDGSKQVAMLNPERGGFSLTLTGGERLHEITTFDVEIDFTPENEGTIFVKGIKRVGESIREGDEVCIMKDNRLIGVGVAVMGSLNMNSARNGAAVKVRHLANLA